MIQTIINQLYRYPKSHLKKIQSFGGFATYYRMQYGRRQMQQYAAQLPPVQSNADGLPIYFLTGRDYLYQTLFCIRSLVLASAEKFHFILVDDGSFTAELISHINRQLPGATVVKQAIINQNLQKHLPNQLYPALHHKRRIYPHIKKLTDIHTLNAPEWKIVLDSDMLFWNEPAELISWLKEPDGKPLHMVDCQESYGYSQQLMQSLCGHQIPELLNVGAIGLNSSAIYWPSLESWIKELELHEGTSYYLEQALSAMLVAGSSTSVLNQGQYIVNPSMQQITHSGGMLHHYVDTSKYGYYTLAWKKLMPDE